MDEQKIREIEEEVNELLEKVREDEEVMNTPLPDGLEKNIKKRIRAIEVEKMEHAIDEELAKADELADVVEFPREAMSAEDEEWIRLGKIYKKKQKSRKYFVAAAVAIFVLALGVTSIGGPEKVFEKVNWMLAGREQTNVDSDDDDVIQLENVEEEEVYQQIEDKFGFVPVRMYVLPDNVGFLEANIGEEIQGATILYGKEDKVRMTYVMRPNYRTGSFSKDIEDELLEEYIEETEYTDIYIRKYQLESDVERWAVQFEYKNVSYSMLIMDTNQKEVEKIVKNLIFS